jgi:hypothetical protein
MRCGGSTAVGATSIGITERLPTAGRFMTIRNDTASAGDWIMRRTTQLNRLNKRNKHLTPAGRALRRAARAARKTARLHGTPIYLWRDGKVVAEKA